MSQKHLTRNQTWIGWPTLSHSTRDLFCLYVSSCLLSQLSKSEAARWVEQESRVKKPRQIWAGKMGALDSVTQVSILAPGVKTKTVRFKPGAWRWWEGTELCIPCYAQQAQEISCNCIFTLKCKYWMNKLRQSLVVIWTHADSNTVPFLLSLGHHGCQLTELCICLAYLPICIHTERNEYNTEK